MVAAVALIWFGERLRDVAERSVFGKVGIDMLAGLSELLVVAR